MYSIGITTFVHRFGKYYKPLMNAISRMRPDVDKVIFVNAQHKKDFDQDYRRDIMRFSSLCPKTYLIMSPVVRGCSHMFNTISNYTSSDYILILNDDVIVQDGFFDEFETALRLMSDSDDESFRINNSFSHFCINRKDLFRVGYFDERLLGFGEEDGDWLWRWEATKGRTIKTFFTNKIVNCIDSSDTNSENMEKGRGKYSAFNSRWLFSHKYEGGVDPTKQKAISMYGKPMQMRDGAFTPDYYPAEKWYRDNINCL